MELPSADQHQLVEQLAHVRQHSRRLCEPLEIEDFGLQAVAETSPIKWHLAHTTWFFETFLLKPFLTDYSAFHPAFEHLFNSYYNAVGAQYPRARRHLLSRPTVAEVFAYRDYVDEHLRRLLERRVIPDPDVQQRLILGLHHEQQHQELMLTDLKYNFLQNPLYPAYRAPHEEPDATAIPLHFIAQEDLEIWVGHDMSSGFAFDNEMPRHRTYLPSFAIANRLVNNGEYLAFIKDGGYQRPQFWLSDGWAHIQNQGWTMPQQWIRQGDQFLEFTLHGLKPIDPQRPVTHISYYEADAFAQWHGSRLCSEFEWEAVATRSAPKATTWQWHWLHPQPPRATSQSDNVAEPIQQLMGCAWQWTRSAYAPYPGFQAGDGALGEYNGKFMCNQMVLRGSSCITPEGHARITYRNFFYPQDRWQFTGIRLARDWSL